MTARLSPLHPLSWPLWLKFMVGIAAGLVAFAIPTYLFVRSGIYDLSIQNAQSFVTQIGVKHAAAVDNAFVQARGALDSFAANEDNQQNLIGFLLRDLRTDAQTYLPHVTESQVADLLRSNLLNPAAASFDSIRLLDSSGQVLVNATVSNASFTHTDDSQSPAYRAIRGGQPQAQASAVAISQTNAPVVELVDTIFWRDGTPLGYIVATLSNGRIFFNNIRLDDTTANDSAYTFLSTAQGVLIAPTSIRARALGANRSVAVENALAGQTGVTTYSANDGADYIGYYTPIGGTPFVLVTQAPANVVYSNTLAFFQVRTFVVVTSVIALVALLALMFSQLTVPALNRLRRATQALSDGDFDVDVPDAKRGDEIGRLAASFVNMRDQAQTLMGDLETRVAARTRDLNAMQEISRFAATQHDLQTLMDRAVNLIVERFPAAYYAQLFLIDEDERDAVLRAGTGEAGMELLRRGHRLGVGSVSLIGQVTQQGRLIVVRDTAASPIHHRNEFLPETAAELTIPLHIGETIIGALDVQSKMRDAFDADLVDVLQAVADQIAVAIQNALLSENSVRRIDEIQDGNREATRRAWQEFIRDQRMDAIVKEAGYSTDTDISDLRRAAIASGEPVVGQVTARRTIPIAVPVMLRGQVLGAVEWEIPAQSLSEEKLELAKELANRLALSLDNARLFQESQRATERERLVNSIAAKLTAQTTINDILQTAVREVGQALRTPQVSIRLHGSNGVSE